MIEIWGWSYLYPGSVEPPIPRSISSNWARFVALDRAGRGLQFAQGPWLGE